MQTPRESIFQKTSIDFLFHYSSFGDSIFEKKYTLQWGVSRGCTLSKEFQDSHSSSVRNTNAKYRRVFEFWVPFALKECEEENNFYLILLVECQKHKYKIQTNPKQECFYNARDLFAPCDGGLTWKKYLSRYLRMWHGYIHWIAALRCI